MFAISYGMNLMTFLYDGIYYLNICFVQSILSKQYIVRGAYEMK